MEPEWSKWKFESRLIHADDRVPDGPDTAPPLHLSTTYAMGESPCVYSRVSTPTRNRLESVLVSLEGHPQAEAITFSSGLSALAAFLFSYCPRRVFVWAGYRGSHTLFDDFQAHHGRYQGQAMEIIQMEVEQLDFEPEKGDLIYIECPQNPTCDVPDIARLIETAHKGEAFVMVDATFATPVSIQPLVLGADVVLHSCTKYLGGHSDLLGGVLVLSDRRYRGEVSRFRTRMGNVLGAMETFLLLRSLRTLSLRVERQSATAWTIAQWMVQQKGVKKVHHPFLPDHRSHEQAKVYLRLGPACFQVQVENYLTAYLLPNHTRLFVHATSLGGVESSIESRAEVHSVRLSFGLEDPQDLMDDLQAAFLATMQEIETSQSVVEQSESQPRSPRSGGKDERCIIS